MLTLIKSSIILGIISLILGIVSRITVQPFFLEAQSYLEFSQLCFIAAITFLLYKIDSENKLPPK